MSDTYASQNTRMKGALGDLRKCADVIIKPQPGCVCQQMRHVVCAAPPTGKLCSTKYGAEQSCCPVADALGHVMLTHPAMSKDTERSLIVPPSVPSGRSSRRSQSVVSKRLCLFGTTAARSDACSTGLTDRRA